MIGKGRAVACHAVGQLRLGASELSVRGEGILAMPWKRCRAILPIAEDALMSEKLAGSLSRRPGGRGARGANSWAVAV